MTNPPQAVADPTDTTDSQPARKQPMPPEQKRLFGLILPITMAIYLVVGALPAILLPIQVQQLDEANKAANLALVLGIGAVAAMIMGPVAGQLSDRTRSRFGRRTPWLVGGSLGVGLALLGMAAAHGLVQIIIAWVIVQIMFNLVVGPLQAIMPDRVPSGVRGLFATLLGLGAMLGAIGGQVVGAALAADVDRAYLILPGILIIAVGLFVVLCPDKPSKDRVNEPFDLRAFLGTFWVSPTKHPDFAWNFAGRLLLFTGYFAVTGYQLYILQDYIGMHDGAVGAVPLLGGISLLGMIVTMSFSGVLSDKLGRRKVFVIAASLIMGVAMIIPIVAPNLPGMMVFSFICGMGFGSYMAVDGALMTEVLPSEGSYAKDLGVLNIASTLPQTVGPFLSGAIVLIGGYSALFPVGAVLALLGALAIIPIKSVR